MEDKFSTLRFNSPSKPEYYPNHRFLNSCLFYDRQEADFVCAMAILAEKNGMTVNEVTNLISPMLRMLKSKSEWSK